jgi:hypothetical protein
MKKKLLQLKYQNSIPKSTLNFLRKNILTALFFMLPIIGFAQSSQTFSTAGTYTFTVPAGVNAINIEAWGAGGAGGGATGTNSAGSGGAGGGFARRNNFNVTPGATYTVTIGTGGIGSRNNGTSGGSSSLANGATTILLAIGGNGALAATGNNTYSFGANAVTTGNTGFTGTLNYYGGKGGDGVTPSGSAAGGGGGSSAGTGSNGNAGVNQTGGSAVTGGVKGADGFVDSGDGAAGSAPGGAGAGATALTKTDRSGGNGGDGQVIVSWTCPVYLLSSTSIATPQCSTYAATVTISGSTTGLPIGTYTATYNVTGANTSSGNTAIINVTTAGTGSFTTVILPNSGNTTITITNLATATCSNNLVLFNSASVNVAATPTITSSTPGSRTGTGTVLLSATASAGTISWFANETGGTALASGNNFTTPSITTTTIYYIQATAGSCTVGQRVAIEATINNPEIAVSGNGFNIIDDSVTPNTNDFTNLGSTNLSLPLTRTYTVSNLGSAILNLGIITISGINASEFTATNPPSSIAPQSSATFTVTFTPTVIGTRNASLSFTTDDADENPFNFLISGTGDSGVSPEINVQGNSINVLAGSSAGSTANNTDFGSPLVNTNVTKTFTIQNLGTGPLLLTGTPGVMLSGDSAFTVTTQPSSNIIGANSSLTFQVTFNSSISGNFLAIVNIFNDDNDESIYDFVITANATVSGVEIDIQGNDISIVSGDTTPSTLDQTDFGITDSSTLLQIPFQIFSFGTSNLVLTSSVTVTALTGSGFSASTIANPTTLTTVNNITSFVVTFTPSATLGIRTARITVSSNDPDEGKYTFVVRAEVRAPATITTAPGGATANLKFWLKADSNIGNKVDGATMTAWDERTTASTKNAVAKIGKEPKFNHNVSKNVNFNPVIYFNGSNSMSGGQGFNNLDMFIVVKPTGIINRLSGAKDTYCGDDITSNKPSQDVTGFEMGNTSARFNNEILAYNQSSNGFYGVGEINVSKSYTGVNIFNPRKVGSRMGIFNNGSSLATTEVNTGSYKDITNSRYWLGASETFGPSYEGDILEVINYDITNSITDRRRIETYLAIKYGITLGSNGTSLDYYNSSSTNTATSIYEESAGYNYNIAGIGRDDKSELKQRQSKTENTDNDITIGLGGIFDKNTDNPNNFVNDKEFLVWGNNNGTLLAQPAVRVNLSSGISPALTTEVEYITVGRTWKVKETGGNIPIVKVSIPSTLLTSTITPPGDFLMFISNSPAFNAASEYRIMRVNGSKLETEYDFDGVKYITFGYAPQKTFERAVDFNGTTDYMDAGKVLDLNSSFTVSVWVKKNGNDRSIFSKRNNPYTVGYDLSINSAGKAEMTWFNGTKQSIVSSIIIPTGKWHNICVVYDNSSSTTKMYIDGFLDATKTLSSVPASPTLSFLIAAANGAAPTSFFNGTIDEVRIWSVPLTEDQLRYVMNQEILSNGIVTNGKILPNNISRNEISAIPWSQLSAYYPMSTYTFTNAKDVSSFNNTAAIKNIKTVNVQTAPLPYESLADGNWETVTTWKNNSVQDIPYSLSIVDDTETIDWNIVKTTHNIVSRGNKTVLGLYVGVGTGSKLTATTVSGAQTDGTKIEVSHYLKLDGKIDLVGRSQLVQKSGSDLDITSSGTLERDQQGQSSKYNYNYWSSPVGSISSTANNTPFTIGGVLRDGTNPAAPATINWVGGFDGAPTTPISLARFWVYKFDNSGNDIANFSRISETGTLQAGKGFTLKGSGASSANQNLTFVGKPNNGTISNTVGADQLLLAGNPYPSALDADKFINDNINTIANTNSNPSIDGTLYFWEQYNTNPNHVLRDYQGGYAIRNLSGGVAPSSIGVDFISGRGTTSKAAPNQFIPVGQGFFVFGKVGTTGNVIFNNSQRDFHKEDEVGVSQITYKMASKSKSSSNSHWTDESNNPLKKDDHKKVLLAFNSYNENFHRQALLAFMNEQADSELNDGYDAFNIDESPTDMYLLNGENELAIQGEGFYDENQVYPIGIRKEVAGKISFALDEIKNFEPGQPFFILDKLTNTYNSIVDKVYEVEVPVGKINDRFFLTFKDDSKPKTTAVSTGISVDEPVMILTNKEIKVISKESKIQKIDVFDILGKKVDGYKRVDNFSLILYSLPKTNSAYIVKITLQNNEVVTKKIVY